jgi:phage terminase small subunit
MFCHEYLKDFNGAAAAVRADYSERSAKVQASTLLTRPNVKAEIDRLQKQLAQKVDISAERVIQELACIAFVKADDVADFGPDGVLLKSSKRMSQDTLRAIESIMQTKDGVRVKMHSKTTALELIGKRLGIWKDHVKHDIPENVARVVFFPSNGREVKK